MGENTNKSMCTKRQISNIKTYIYYRYKFLINKSIGGSTFVLIICKKNKKFDTFLYDPQPLNQQIPLKILYVAAYVGL